MFFGTHLALANQTFSFYGPRATQNTAPGWRTKALHGRDLWYKITLPNLTSFVGSFRLGQVVHLKLSTAAGPWRCCAVVNLQFEGESHMQYISIYQTPVGETLLACDDIGLTGLWFKGGKYYALNLDKEHRPQETPFFSETARWLDIYFSGREPDFMPPIHMVGSPFQLSVWELLRKIPYGETTTYGEIARSLAAERGLPHMSAQAVGGAVGHNPISIIIPCHRVIAANGSLTGYAGGLQKKRNLLAYEGVRTAPASTEPHS